LSYPVTNHSISPNHRQGTWLASARLPNSLRFKVRPDLNDATKLRGVVFHVPCRPPAEFAPERATIERVWPKVHGLLDQFDAVTLERIAE
jgi:CRISPR-associated protein Cmr1